MNIDWVAVYGAVLSTLIAAAGAFRWLRAKPAEREAKVRRIFEGILGPLIALQNGMQGENRVSIMKDFLKTFRNYRDEIRGNQSVLKREAPQISSQLLGFIDLLEKRDPFRLLIHRTLKRGIISASAEFNAVHTARVNRPRGLPNLSGHDVLR